VSNQPTPHAPGHVYDIAIIGAGIAGCEAAWRCARAGIDTLLVTTSLDTLYNLLGDKIALDPPEDTLMARVFAEVQQDGIVGNWVFHRRAKTILETETNVHLLQSSVTALLHEQKQVTGLRTWEGVDRLARHTALCVGSFLHARLTIGTLTEVAGRLSEMAYDDLADHLLELGITLHDTRLEASFDDSSLPYHVDCQTLKDNVSDDYQVRGFTGLYAAGVCRGGYLPFVEAALEGKHLADHLIRASQTAS
jgi:tRNA U34 5-carboxymethylaminomethyl modifying enzyme MnmG/GidA